MYVCCLILRNMQTRRLVKRAITAAAISVGLGAASLIYATPAYAYQCRIVRANDMRVFATATGDTLTPPWQITLNRRFRNYGTSNGRFSISVHVGVWYAGWVSADPRWSDPVQTCP
jgi:hypothetical protein